MSTNINVRIIVGVFLRCVAGVGDSQEHRERVVRIEETDSANREKIIPFCRSGDVMCKSATE